MKLLFDQNISYRLVKKIDDIYPNSKQVKEVHLENKNDSQIFNYAKNNGYTIVTFDADFFDLSNLKGFLPKIKWIRTENISTKNLEKILTRKKETILHFLKSVEFGCLEIYDN